MPNISIASQLEAIQKQKEILLKKEAALKAQSHGKILSNIVKMARDAGLTLGDITEAFNHKSSKKNKPKTSKASTKSNSGKAHTRKGVKLPPKYKNPADPRQTWTGRGVDPIWIAKLRESGQLESALITPPTD